MGQGSRRPLWYGRTSARAALLALCALVPIAGIVALFAGRWSPLAARSALRLDTEARAVFLTTLPDDPARVNVSTKRESTSLDRDEAALGGDPYWIHRYRDPERGGLPERILLTSRSRGARLLLPLGALDLEQALSAARATPPPVNEPVAGTAVEPARATPIVESALVQLFVDRLFAGLYLELRFPEREIGKDEKAIDYDLVVVRGNRVRTTDFLLQPNAELYRAALSDGVLPSGPLLRNPSTGDELVYMLSETMEPGRPLFVPIPLFDELALAWGEDLSTIVDDRWQAARFPAYESVPPSGETRSWLAWEGQVHLSARIERADESATLAGSIDRFAHGPVAGASAR